MRRDLLPQSQRQMRSEYQHLQAGMSRRWSDLRGNMLLSRPNLPDHCSSTVPRHDVLPYWRRVRQHLLPPAQYLRSEYQHLQAELHWWDHGLRAKLLWGKPAMLQRSRQRRNATPMRRPNHRPA